MFSDSGNVSADVEEHTNSEEDDPFFTINTQPFETLALTVGKVTTIGEHMNLFHAHPNIRYNLSSYEFAAICEIATAQDEKVLVPKDTTRGRPKILRLPFSDLHPLYREKFIHLRSKHLVPSLSGRVPNHLQPEPQDASKRRAWWAKLKAWAIFVDVTFLPWDETLALRLRTPVQSMYSWLHSVEHAVTRKCLEALQDRTCIVNLGRL